MFLRSPVLVPPALRVRDRRSSATTTITEGSVGYNPESLDADLALNDITRFLAKPFDPGVLAGVVRDCLDSK